MPRGKSAKALQLPEEDETTEVEESDTDEGSDAAESNDNSNVQKPEQNQNDGDTIEKGTSKSNGNDIPVVNMAYKCDLMGCEMIFTAWARLERHIQYEHLCIPPPRIDCDVEGCGKYFEKPAQLRQHRMLIHEQGKQFKCPDCDFTAYVKSNLHNHKLKVHGVSRTCSYSGCGMTFSSYETEREHYYFDHHDYESIYKCDHCDKVSQHMSQMASHMQTIHSVSKFLERKCPQCGQLFPTTNMLSLHAKAHHSDLKIYPCYYCDLVLTNEDDQKAHHESVHSDLCNKRRNSQNRKNFVIQTKRRESTPLKPAGIFICDIDGCGRAFPYEGRLRIHYKAHGYYPKLSDKEQKALDKRIKYQRQYREAQKAQAKAAAEQQETAVATTVTRVSPRTPVPKKQNPDFEVPTKKRGRPKKNPESTNSTVSSYQNSPSVSSIQASQSPQIVHSNEQSYAESGYSTRGKRVTRQKSTEVVHSVPAQQNFMHNQHQQPLMAVETVNHSHIAVQQQYPHHQQHNQFSFIQPTMGNQVLMNPQPFQSGQSSIMNLHSAHNQLLQQQHQAQQIQPGPAVNYGYATVNFSQLQGQVMNHLAHQTQNSNQFMGSFTQHQTHH